MVDEVPVEITIPERSYWEKVLGRATDTRRTVGE
jgi:hypothetical protein